MTGGGAQPVGHLLATVKTCQKIGTSPQGTHQLPVLETPKKRQCPITTA